MTAIDARALTLALLAARAPGATICPSEVARAIAAAAGHAEPDGWREAMPTVHAAVDAMVRDGVVHLTWKGTSLAARAGPYRIARGRSD